MKFASAQYDQMELLEAIAAGLCEKFNGSRAILKMHNAVLAHEVLRLRGQMANMEAATEAYLHRSASAMASGRKRKTVRDGVSFV